MTRPGSPAAGRAEALAAWALRGPMTAVVAATCLAYLACWAPHYLTWPFYSDHDAYATIALGWDRGDLPYRDVLCNNFPGQIYLFWLLGRVAGWGRTVPFYAVDVILLLAFGAALVVWSRRRFGAALPGLVGFGAALAYYLGLDYSLTAQRDWHAPLLAALGLLVAQAWPGRAGRWASALALAAASTVRPQAVLFLPAAALAVDEGARRPGEPPLRAAGALLEWGAAYALGLAAAFAPLVAAGVWPDFVRGVRLAAPGGGYSQVGLASMARGLAAQLAHVQVLAVAGAVALLALSSEPARRRTAPAWLAATAGVLLYKPLSPSPHASYLHPLMLVAAVDSAVLVGLLIAAGGLAATARLAAVLLVWGLAVRDTPRFCNPGRAAAALAQLRGGAAPTQPPPGYATNPGVPFAAAYDWADYAAVLDHLRRTTGPETRVANALKACPALAAPAARRTALPAESVEWLTLVAPADEPRFVAALEGATDSVVVWAPSESGKTRFDYRSDLAPLRTAIRRLYAPQARFGAIEVWRRKTAAELAAAGTGSAQ